ncbi:basic leucine zipper 23-like [Hordeum vulgare subsp. vulgare]|uniref:BZIP domain-containing protein n=1 Tax=Hordeum vulgare subsp. vulgare TaxID=112509 RepID=A0A8I6W708_HORVV|nr:basic leucine zipper 23-like [Hordeum vulgare subsp. vulgare]
MDDGVDLPSQFLFSNSEMPGAFDDLLADAAATCTHTHTCNPPGPSATMHTHTCLHTHTHQLFAAGSEDDDAARPRRPLGNREAVRKYREKKKAHAAFLEEEVKKLRAANQQLLRRLQGHATLEAEVARLRGLLSDVRAKIDAEVVAGAFPFQKQCSVGSVACTDPTLCFNNGNSEVGGACWGDSSGPASADCGLDEDANGAAAREVDAPGRPVRAMDVVELCFPS